MSMLEPYIVGFTLLRNGVKYDYPFEESLKSLAPATRTIYLALGKGEDETEDRVSSMDNIEIIPTLWDERLREGGLILSQQTNIALNGAREGVAAHLANAWGIYLQCDEVLHEDDIELIKTDIARAHKDGADAMAFRFLHFWQEPHALAINKKWYPHEIRAVKLNTQVESWGDAQSFRKWTKVYYSEARIFHYGHVREKEKYQLKKADILKLYHSDEKMNKYKKREKRFDDQTKTLDYWGPHPTTMHARLDHMGCLWQKSKVNKVAINSPASLFSSSLRDKINAAEVAWESSHGDHFIDFNSAIIPLAMESKLARPWSNDFRLTLHLSRLGIGVMA